MTENKDLVGSLMLFLDRHKIKIAIALAVLVILGFLLMQMGSRIKYDAYILYIGSQFVDSMTHTALTDAVCEIAPFDFYEDGEINISFSPMLYLTEAAREEYDKEELYYNLQTNVETLQEFYRTVSVGTYIILLMDDEVYEELLSREESVLRPLSEIFTEIPENARDEYSFYLKDTPLAEKLTENRDLPFPENTVICLRSFPYISSLVNKEEKIDIYEHQTSVFTNLVKGNG